MRTLTRLLLASGVLAVAAADWPQWRGPDRDGISKETGLLKTWPKTGPDLAWTYQGGGTGYSAPAVVGGKIYLPGARDGTEYLLALDDQGKELWAAKIGPMYDFKGNAWSGGPNSTPSVDGDLIIVAGSQGIVLCVDKTGKEVWRKDLVKDVGAAVNPVGGDPAGNGWGFSWSPLVDGKNLIVTPGGPKGLFAALNKTDGTVVWQSKDVTDKCTYGSPVAAEIGGVRQYITLVQNGVVAVSAKTGALLWQHRHEDPYPDVVCGTPLVQGNLVYLSVGYGAGAELLKVTGDGQKFKVEVVYANKEIGNKQGGVVLVDGFVYGNHEARFWVCQDFMTGAVKWQSPRRGLPAGAVLYADGNLYCVCQDRDEIGLIAASSTAYKENGRFPLPQKSALRKPSGRLWTLPALSDGKLYVRDQELLFCYKVK
jgi:outer membrane protein assembly factor BamB